MIPLKILYLARDTETICLFENRPVREIFENGFAFVDTKSKWHSQLQDDELKNHIRIGDVLEIPLYSKDFFEKILYELNFLKNYISQ